MALVAGNLVTPLASFPAALFGQEAPSYGGAGVPLIGVVESVAASNVTVDWSNGDVVTYADAGANTLVQVLPAIDPTLYHKMVTFNVPVPNVYGSSIGIIIAVFSIVIGASPAADFVIVKFENGDTMLEAAAAFIAVDVNPNVTG